MKQLRLENLNNKEEMVIVKFSCGTVTIGDMEFATEDIQMVATLAMNEMIKNEIEIVNIFEIEINGGDRNYESVEGTCLRDLFTQVGLEFPDIQVSPGTSLHTMTDYEMYKYFNYLDLKTGKATALQIKKEDIPDASFDFDYIQISLK